MFLNKRKILYLAVFVFCVISLSGCISMKEYVKGLFGVSTKEIESSRDLALKKVFPIGIDECYTKTEDLLKEIGCYIYSSNKTKGLIAFYVSRADTTVAGVFLTRIDQENTRLEVSSPSSYQRDIIANKLFTKLELAIAPPKEEIQEDVK